MPENAVPDPHRIRSIVAIAEPALRNLQITQAYHELALALHQRTGASGVNWCSLGTWASKTAGGFIRMEEFPRRLRTLLDGRLDRMAEELGVSGLGELVSRIVDSISAHLMEGNRVVFEELAGTVAELLYQLGDHERHDEAAIERFVAGFDPGEPMPDQVWFDEAGEICSAPHGGQSMLAEMCRAYYAAMFERDEKRRAELLLLANAAGGIHEQTRLQTYIEGALNAPVRQLLLEHCHQRVDSCLPLADREQAHQKVEQLVPVLAKVMERAFCEFSTVGLMTLKLPDGSIRLSESVRRDDDSETLYPPELNSIDNQRLRSLFDHFDAWAPENLNSKPQGLGQRLSELFKLRHGFDDDDLVAVGATDWTKLRQRMRFILALFRVRAQDPDLHAAPFSPSQRQSLSEGRMPRGPL